jgi:hypothetical protein
MTTVAQTDTLGQFILPAPTTAHVYFNDFDTYTAAEWTVTETGVATQALTDADGGRLLITNAAADNDASFSQKVGESFLFATGKKVWFEALFQVSDATQSDFVMGLQITDTTPLAVTDGVYFRKDDGDANIDFVVIKDSTATTTTAVTTAADATDIKLGFYFDGVDKITIFVDGVALGSSVTTNLPDDEVLTVSYGIQNGEAVAKTMTLDYILAAKER